MTIYGNDMVGLEISSSLLATLCKLKDVAFEVATAASTINCEVVMPTASRQTPLIKLSHGITNLSPISELLLASLKAIPDALPFKCFKIFFHMQINLIFTRMIEQ